MNNIPVKIGQEWTLKNNPHSYVVIKVEPDRACMYKYKDGCSKYKIYDYLRCNLNTNIDKYWVYSLWNYMGVPVACEYCNDFCRQLCKIKR